MCRARVAAVQHNRSKAAEGDPAAQYELGERYHDGLGVQRDYAEALTWFLRASVRGHAKAQANAGMMLYLGRGCVSDRVEAVKWLVLSAEAGEPKAQVALDKISGKLPVEDLREGRRRAADYRTTRTSP